MADALLGTETAVLRRAGVALLLVGASVLMTKPLESNLGAGTRVRAVLSLAVGLYAFRAWHQNPEYGTAVALAGTAVALLVPLALSFVVFRELLVVN
jgi:hypothetical protein